MAIVSADSRPDDPHEGERRRDEALARLRALHPALVRRLQRTFLAILVQGPSSVDVLRDRVPIPAGIDPRIVGAAVRPLAYRHGLIRRVGHELSSRRPAHMRELKRWELCDGDAAEAWLAAHPSPGDEAAPQQQLLLF